MKGWNRAGPRTGEVGDLVGTIRAVAVAVTIRCCVDYPGACGRRRIGVGVRVGVRVGIG